jgi:hypothetical protein
VRHLIGGAMTRPRCADARTRRARGASRGVRGSPVARSSRAGRG